MKNIVKKVIFLTYAFSSSFGIIVDVMQSDSVITNIWGQYHAIWLLVILSIITIFFLVNAAITYLLGDKAGAYKILLIVFILNMINSIIDSIFTSMISKHTLIQWITINRQDNGLPVWEVPTAVKYMMWGYVVGIASEVIFIYFVYRHWRKINNEKKKSSALPLI